jgi:hypothetical protein
MLQYSLIACTTSSDGATAEVPPQPRQDTPYFDVHEKWHKEESIVSSLQKKLEVHALLLTDEFRRAYVARFQRLRGVTQDSLGQDIGRRVGVLVSVFSPEKPYESLDDRRLWTIQLKYGINTLANPEIKSLNDKVLLDPFFPFVNQWSREFILAFDPTAGTTGDSGGDETPLPDSVTLIMRSALTSVEVRWP